MLAADGSLSGEITDEFTGGDATRERRFLKESDGKKLREELEESLSGDLPDLDFKGYEFHQTNELDKPVRLDFK